jgi:hypothetical protein
MKGSLCKFCGQSIKWIKTKNGKNMPLDPIGIEPGDILYDRERHSSHWDTCPKRDNAREQYPRQDAPASVMNPHLTELFNKYVKAVQAGMGYEKMGQDFLQAVERAHKPAAPPKTDDMYDDDVPF